MTAAVGFPVAWGWSLRRPDALYTCQTCPTTNGCRAAPRSKKGWVWMAAFRAVHRRWDWCGVRWCTRCVWRSRAAWQASDVGAPHRTLHPCRSGRPTPTRPRGLPTARHGTARRVAVRVAFLVPRVFARHALTADDRYHRGRGRRRWRRRRRRRWRWWRGAGEAERRSGRETEREKGGTTRRSRSGPPSAR